MRRNSKQLAHRIGSVTMAETIEQRLGIDRCERPVEMLFALAEFKWCHDNDHEWEVGRWPGLRLTLLAQPEWGPHRPPFAICPLPGSRSYSDTRGASVSVFPLTATEIRRDVRSCAHRAFDLAVRLQLRHFEARYMKSNRRTLHNLPCMKSMMEIQYRFTAPMAGIHMANSIL